MNADLFTVSILLVLLLVRVLLATFWELRAYDEAHELNVADLARGRIHSMGQLDERYERVRPFPLVVMDLRQWRYRSPFKA